MASRARVRAYRPDDREACLEVFDSNVPEFFRSLERGAFVGFLDDLPGPMVVVEEAPSGRIVGCGGVAVEGGGEASLCWGMIRRECHGRGLGHRLLEARMEILRDDPSCRRARLETIPATTGFFRRMGFREILREADGYGPGMDRVVLVLDLDDYRADSSARETET